MSKQGKEDMDRTNRVIELTERFEKSMQESFDEIMAFKKDFQKYRDEKENEVSELDEKYGSLTKETLNRVNEFEKTITLNVGGMLKDLNDIKLQLTSSFQRSAS
jgi:predicted nuclease with TOPRIM domain